MEQLIEAVKIHRVLWDTRLPEYRDLNAREKAWSEIATGLNKEKKTVKEDWRKLRDSHRNAVARRSTKSGQATEKRKKWKYEDQMEFLIATNEHRRGESNIPLAATPVVEEGAPAAPATSQDDGDDAEAIDDNTASTHEQAGSSTGSQYREKRFREPRQFDKVLNFLQEKEKRKQRGSTPDELDLFFASITKSVRNLPRNLQLRLKREILNSVTQAEEEQERMRTTPPAHGLGPPATYRPGSSISEDSFQTNYSNQSIPSDQWEGYAEVPELQALSSELMLN